MPRRRGHRDLGADPRRTADRDRDDGSHLFFRGTSASGSAGALSL
jgi:hypothetical protein